MPDLRKAESGKSFNTQPPEGGWAKERRTEPNMECFNTQPPEGGWASSKTSIALDFRFQHTAARRRLANPARKSKSLAVFQHTAARRRLGRIYNHEDFTMGFNTQPPEGGWAALHFGSFKASCFNTQPPEGGWQCSQSHAVQRRRFNTQPPEGGCCKLLHTTTKDVVSTHSRPKVAVGITAKIILKLVCFNTQPPEGGCTKQNFRFDFV